MAGSSGQPRKRWASALVSGQTKVKTASYAASISANQATCFTRIPPWT